MTLIKTLIESPLDFEPKDIQEPYTQYVRHFIYMVKRNERMGNQPIGYGSDSENTSVGHSKAKAKSAKKVPVPSLQDSSESTVKRPTKKKKASPKKK